MDELKYNFQGSEYKAQPGAVTVNINGICFCVEDQINELADLKQEVIKWNGYENLNIKIIDWLELAGIENEYEIVNKLEDQVQYRELEILAYIDNIEIQGNVIKYVSNRLEKYFKTDLSGRLIG